MAKPTLSTIGGPLLALGYAGQLTHDLGFQDIDHAVNTSATAIDYGVAVTRDGVDGCKPFAAIGDDVIGISVRTSVGVYNSGGTVGYSRYASVPVLRSGYLYVEAGENVTVGTGVIALTASAGKLGGVSAGAAGAGRRAIANATWETTTVSGEIGMIRLS